MSIPCLLLALLLCPAAALNQAARAVELLKLAPQAGLEAASEVSAVAGASTRDAGYFWPSGIGRFGEYSVSSYAAPFNLSASFSWSWHNPEGRYRSTPVGTTIDHQQNIYLTELTGIRKFSPGGRSLWTYTRNNASAELSDAAALLDGRVYATSMDGRVVAVSMESGEEMWSTQAGNSTDSTNGFVAAHDGIVIVGTDATMHIRGRSLGSTNRMVTALNATDGRILWKFLPDVPVWNFLASFVGDGTFTFQDLEGRVYRNRVSDGALVWKAGGVVGTWTDGSSILGPNGIVYAVNTYRFGVGPPDSPGALTAYRLDDGKQLWQVTTPRPPNNVPAVGRLMGQSGLSVVQPMGQQVLIGAPTDVYAFDAETGKVQWVFHGPSQRGLLQAGELEGAHDRTAANVRTFTMPNPWSAPSIDANGTVFIGSEAGAFYALRDWNGDGEVAGDMEVSRFGTESCFSGSSSPAHARGMLVVSSMNAMYVFD